MATFDRCSGLCRAAHSASPRKLTSGPYKKIGRDGSRTDIRNAAACLYPAPNKPEKRHHVVVGGPRGISSVKLVPRGEVGSLSSPPSCFESALTKRVPSRLLVVES